MQHLHLHRTTAKPAGLMRLAATCLLLLLCSCGEGDRSALPDPPAASGGLPALSELPDFGPLRQGSYLESDLFREGSDFDNNLANNLVSPDGAIATFTPDNPGGSPENGLAYCIYRFELLGYDRNPQVRINWQTAPAAGTLFIALANWTSGRWDLFPADPAVPLDLPEIESYIQQEGATNEYTLLCSVICTGSQQAGLASIRIGSEAPVISTDGLGDLRGFIPLSAELNASASSDPDGEIVSFEWDLDGDGSFETDKGLDPLVQISQTLAGGYHIGLRVTDDDGVASEARYPLSAFSEWQRSWGGGGLEESDDSAFDGVGSIYLAGTTKSFGAGGIDIVLLKYDLAGEIVWQRTWGTGVDEYCSSVAVDSLGDIVVLGRSDDNGAVVLKFSPAGDLLWEREYTPLSNIFVPAGLDLVGTDIYFSGFQFGGQGTESCCIARLNASGAVTWIRRWSNGKIWLEDLQTFLGTPFKRSIAVVGSRDDKMFYLELDADGDFRKAEYWDSPENSRAKGLVATGPFNGGRWICGTESSGGSLKAVLIDRFAGYGKSWDAGSGVSDQESSQGLVRGSDGRIWIAGWTNSFTPQDGLLLGFNPAGALQLSERMTINGKDCNFNAGLDLMAGVALACSGWSNQADGSGWQSAGGSISELDYDWVELADSISNVSEAGALASGVLGTPSSAVLNSGGGSSDIFICVRELP